MAGGGSVDASVILNPSKLAGYGLDATEPLAKKIEDLGALDIADMLVFGLGYLAIMSCFVLMAINIFIAVLEYYLFAACVGILLPFGLVASTKFLAEKAIGAVVAAGIKLMVLSFVTAAIQPVITGLKFSGPEIKLNELWAMLLSIGAMSVLCWKAPALASSLLSGSPNLSAGEFVAMGAGAAAAGGAMALSGARTAASLQATRAAAGGAINGGGGAGTSHHASRSAAGGAASSLASALGGGGSASPGGSRAAAAPDAGSSSASDSPSMAPASGGGSAPAASGLVMSSNQAPPPPFVSPSGTVIAFPAAASAAVRGAQAPAPADPARAGPGPSGPLASPSGTVISFPSAAVAAEPEPAAAAAPFVSPSGTVIHLPPPLKPRSS